MNSNRIKSLATGVRDSIRAEASARLDAVLAEGSRERIEAPAQVAAIEADVREHGSDEVVDRAAYTWFNRLRALSFMDVNGYTPERVVTPREDFDPTRRSSGLYLDSAQRIEIVDPYIRAFHQCRNLMEVMEVVLRHVDYTKASPQVHLVTAVEEWNPDKQVEYLQRIRDTLETQDIDFTWDFSETIHARHIYVDDRWDIVLDPGLDIWQKFDSNDAFALEGRMPEMRRVRQFEVTYLKVGE